MAKKIDPKDEREPVRPDALEPSVAAETVAAVAEPVPATGDARKLYTVTQWRGRTKHNCTLCAWDTFYGEAAIVDHIAKAHLAQVQAESKILIARR